VDFASLEVAVTFMMGNVQEGESYRGFPTTEVLEDALEAEFSPLYAPFSPCSVSESGESSTYISSPAQETSYSEKTQQNRKENLEKDSSFMHLAIEEVLTSKGHAETSETNLDEFVDLLETEGSYYTNSGFDLDLPDTSLMSADASSGEQQQNSFAAGLESKTQYLKEEVNSPLPNANDRTWNHPTDIPNGTSCSEVGPILIKSKFHDKYWRNDRKNLQCFPMCPEFGNYYAMRVQNKKHAASGGGTCSGTVIAEFSNNSPIPVQNLIALSRINLATDDGKSTDLRAGMILKALDFQILSKHCLLGKARSTEGNRVEMVFKATCWKLTVELSKKRRPKHMPQMAPKYCFEVICAVEQPDTSIKILGNAVSRFFHIASTRTLAREIEAMSESQKANTTAALGLPQPPPTSTSSQENGWNVYNLALGEQYSSSSTYTSNERSLENNFSSLPSGEEFANQQYVEQRFDFNEEMLLFEAEIDQPVKRARFVGPLQHDKQAWLEREGGTALLEQHRANKEIHAERKSDEEAKIGMSEDKDDSQKAEQQDDNEDDDIEPRVTVPRPMDQPIMLEAGISNDQDRRERPMEAIVMNDDEYLPSVELSSIETAFWYCALLGTFGGHHFYLGRTEWGILYAFTLGLFGIGWIFDLVRLPSLVERTNRGETEKCTVSETYLLWGTLGFLGAHRFCLGQKKWGFYYLFTFGSCGFAWLYDVTRIRELHRQRNNPPEINLADARILWFPGGLVGLHHFYLGDSKRGYLYLFTLGLVGIGWLKDGFDLSLMVENRKRKLQENASRQDIELAQVYT